MGNIGGRADIEIDAPLAAVWAVVQDVVSAPQWQGGIDSVTAIEHDSEGRATLVETESDIRVKKVSSRVRFDYSGAPSRLAWTQEKGDMKSLVGSWELEELDGARTRATFTMEADPGRVLGLLIRGPVVAATRALFVSARPGELRRRMEAEPGS